MLDGRFPQVLGRGLGVNHVSYHLALNDVAPLGDSLNELLNLNVHYNDQERKGVEQLVQNWQLMALNPVIREKNRFFFQYFIYLSLIIFIYQTCYTTKNEKLTQDLTN